ncbi:unnamed protein product, partial [Thlaspi arvense]
RIARLCSTTSLFFLLHLLPLAFAGHDYGDALSKSISSSKLRDLGTFPALRESSGGAILVSTMARPVGKMEGESGGGLLRRRGQCEVWVSDGVHSYNDVVEHSRVPRQLLRVVSSATPWMLSSGAQTTSLKLTQVRCPIWRGRRWEHRPLLLQRPEDMTTSRGAYKIDPNHPGSDLAGETAAAMAAASVVFRRRNPSYAKLLLIHAQQLFQFADKFRGKYDSSIAVAQKYYRSVSGYADELLWAAAWLYRATNNRHYLNYLPSTEMRLVGLYAGVQTLVAKVNVRLDVKFVVRESWSQCTIFQQYQQKAEFFMCSCLGKGGRNFVTSASFLMIVYSDYLTSARKSLSCASGGVSPSRASCFLPSLRWTIYWETTREPQVTWWAMEATTPTRVHHRAASIVSIKVNPTFVTCRGGYSTWYSRKANDPNLLIGALTKETIFEQTEPATYNNAPFWAYWLDSMRGHSGYNQLLAEDIPVPKVQLNPAL